MIQRTPAPSTTSTGGSVELVVIHLGDTASGSGDRCIGALSWVWCGRSSRDAASASEPINGGGSTWSAVAIAAWQADVAREGLTVNYQATGSTAGRQGYTAGTYDFAVSEIPFQPQYCTNPADPSTCYDEQTQPGLLGRPYAYMPIVAGGTSLLYNLQINGQPFKGLRLAPVTLTKIFTGVITNWDDPSIAAENPGVTFPNLKIQPVVRSDGAGTSYQFTAFMAYEDLSDWNAFCKRAGISQAPCPPTSQFPYSALPNGEAEDGSDGVANWVVAPYHNGAIGYAEAAYGINRGVPLASLQNTSGVYVQPTAKNVAVALTKAVINPDHTQNLIGVYTNRDPRVYPMSSYSYMIVPTTDAAPMNLSKGATLGRFILYFLCQGQQEAAPLGYSPLPPNLVQLGFGVEQEIPGLRHRRPSAPATTRRSPTGSRSASWPRRQLAPHRRDSTPCPGPPGRPARRTPGRLLRVHRPAPASRVRRAPRAGRWRHSRPTRLRVPRPRPKRRWRRRKRRSGRRWPTRTPRPPSWPAALLRSSACSSGPWTT